MANLLFIWFDSAALLMLNELCLVKSKLVKLEISHTMILPHIVSVICLNSEAFRKMLLTASNLGQYLSINTELEAPQRTKADPLLF